MPRLDTEEYIEQAYFFRVYRERLGENVPAQDVLASVHEEILSTTKLPMAIEFLRGEILLTGRVSEGMTRLSHYFTPFQTFVMQRAEEDRSRFDQKIALEVLEHEATYRAGGPTPQGLFAYQFECISRNRLGYDYGMMAMSGDPIFDEAWRDWIRKTPPAAGDRGVQRRHLLRLRAARPRPPPDRPLVRPERPGPLRDEGRPHRLGQPRP